MKGGAVGVTLLLLGVSGCARQDAGLPERVLLDGIPTWVYPADHAVPEDPYRVAPEVVFGRGQSGETYLLSSASPIGRAEDGSVFLLDSSERSIHRFSADGEHLGVFGGKGQGPGEFEGLTSALLAQDELLIWDGSLLRLSRFDFRGGLQGVVKLPPQQGWPTRMTRVVPGSLGSDAPYLGITVLNRGNPSGGWPPPSRATWETRLFACLLTEALECTRVLKDSTMVYDAVVLGSENRMYAPGPPRFGRGAWLVAAEPDQPLAWVSDDRFRIDFLDPEGGDRWAAVAGIHRRAVTGIVWDAGPRLTIRQRRLFRNGHR
jgi:hypothetical protein